MPIFKDKDVEIVSKAEALWTKIKESSEQRIKNMEEALIVERAMVELAKEKIKNENK